MHVRSSDHRLFAHGPSKQNLVPILLRNSPSLRKDLDPLFEGFKNRMASALPANLDSVYFRPPVSLDRAHFPTCRHSLLGGTTYI